MLSLPRAMPAPLCVLLLSFFLALPAQGQETARGAAAIEAPALRAELLAMRAADQAMRADVVAFVQASEG